MISPQDNYYSKDLAALLSKVSERKNYAGIYALSKAGNSGYTIIADSQYREGAVAGTDYFSVGSKYPTDVYRQGKSILDKIYNGKSASSFTTSLASARGGRQVVTAYMPIYG